jgi:hypothetical protein
MKYGVVLPIWQRTVAEAESLTLRAEELGLDAVFVPDLTDSPKGTGRAAFQGSVAEVAGDVKRVKGMGAEWMTFDLRGRASRR